MNSNLPMQDAHGIISGKHTGPTVVILGGIHGNERVGVTVLESLRALLNPDRINGVLHLILGNPRAYKENKRFIDTDLNRLFGSGFSPTIQKKEGNYEERCARELAAVLQSADFLLDIHSTIKPSVPFIFTNANDDHMALARLFHTPYIVSPASGFAPKELASSTDNFVDSHGGIGITYESGWHKDSSSFEQVLKNTLTFLKKVGCMRDNDVGARLEISISETSSQHLFIQDHIIAHTDHFVFAKDFNNFDTVVAGEVIARDGSVDGNEVRAEQNAFIIFPKPHILQGQLACYLATS